MTQPTLEELHAERLGRMVGNLRWIDNRLKSGYGLDDAAVREPLRRAIECADWFNALWNTMYNPPEEHHETTEDNGRG